MSMNCMTPSPSKGEGGDGVSAVACDPSTPTPALPLQGGGRKTVAALVVALVLSATAHAQQPPLRLLVWINGDKGYNGLQKVGDEFEKLSGVKVVVQHPEAAPDKFQAAAGAGKGPDIFCWPHDRVGEWAKSGLIVPVRPPKKIRDEIEESSWNAFTWNSQVWGYPLSIEAIGLIYNKALVKTPPATFDEVIALDKELAKQNRRAILWVHSQSFFTFPLLAGAGATVFGRDAKGGYDAKVTGINNDGAVKGAQMLQRLMKEGLMPPHAKYPDMESQFAAGKTALMINGPWAWDNVKKAKIDFGVAPVPAVVPGMPTKPFVGVLGCMITAPSKLKDIGREFIENHLLKIESLKTISADVALGTPANKAYFAELASDPNIAATMANALAGEPIPNIPEMGRVWPAVDAALEAITQGRQSPKDALDGAAARVLTK
jgi:maltose/maltodextrin transport system substrate-binding protein